MTHSDLVTAFYAVMFKEHQQKTISTFLNKLWQEDPFKAKWAIIAKAYTMIRDKMARIQNAHAAPMLSNYLPLVCAQIGIIGVEYYLEILNWRLVYDHAGNKSIAQSAKPNLDEIDEHFMTTQMTEEDLIQYLVNVSFLPGDFMSATPRVPQQHLMAIAPRQLMVQSTAAQQIHQNFLDTISMDPTGVAAQILGFEPNHPFFEFSTNADNNVEENVPEQSQANGSLAVIIPEQPKYKFSGNMAELYRPEDPAINIDTTFGAEWNTIDIGNPVLFDNALQSSGFDSEALRPECK
jgi:hypothetical protein